MANSGAMAQMLLLRNLIGRNARTVRQPDTTATKNARSAKVLDTYSWATARKQQFKREAFRLAPNTYCFHHKYVTQARLIAATIRRIKR